MSAAMVFALFFVAVLFVGTLLHSVAMRFVRGVLAEVAKDRAVVDRLMINQA